MYGRSISCEFEPAVVTERRVSTISFTLICFFVGTIESSDSTATVPPKYSDGPAMIGLDRLPSIPLLVAATSAHNVRGACLGVQNICAVAGGEPRTPTTTYRAATFNSETAEADDRRPNLLALAEAGWG